MERSKERSEIDDVSQAPNSQEKSRDIPHPEGVVHGSGDVFADLGIELSEIDKLKVQIALSINVAVHKKRLTQVEAGALMGIDQAKVSALLKGKLADFSVERLLKFATALGRSIEIRISPKVKTSRGQIKVRDAA